jgi:hypothetical protein
VAPTAAYDGSMSNPNQYGGQAHVAAESKSAGPQIGPHKGPTDRRDLVIAIAAIAVVVAGVLALVLS